MKGAIIAAALLIGAALVPTGAAQAGCLKGAMVGGVAGHFVHHGWLGAAAGCVIGRHETKKHERQATNTTTQNQDQNQH